MKFFTKSNRLHVFAIPAESSLADFTTSCLALWNTKMVVFTCNQCGDSLKKNKVDQHLGQCRTRSFTCIDCLKDFDFQSYGSHFECITEDQKYGGLDYQQHEFKGKSKQNDWIQKIKSLITENQYPRDIQNILRSLVNYENIPRKKPKFANFVKNSFRIRDDQLISKIWDIFETSIKVNSHSNQPTAAANVHENGLKRSITQIEANGDVKGDSNQEKKVKVEPLKPEQEQEETQGEENSEKIKMKKVVKDILVDRDQMTISKLRKRVLRFYHKKGYVEDDSKIERKFENIISKSKFVMKDNLISLAH